MTHTEVAKVLAFAATFDNRKVDDFTIESWRLVIGHLRYDDAMQAIALHRRESSAYLEPAHVIACARRVATARHEANIRAIREGSEAERQRAPKPANFDSMVKAWRDPVAFAKEVAAYNQQLIESGHQPLHSPTDPHNR